MASPGYGRLSDLVFGCRRAALLPGLAGLIPRRAPDEFSEKTHVAKSQRVEVSGELAVRHQAAFQEFMTFRNMSHAELNFEIERLGSQIDHRSLKGAELDAEIDFHEAKLAAMREARAAGYGFVRANWLTRAFSDQSGL